MRHEKVQINHLESEYKVKDSKWLKQLAQAMIDIGGAATPVIVAQLGLRQYQVLMYHQVYWAAKLAMEVDPEFTSVEAVIVETTAEWPNVRLFLEAFAECG